MIKYRLDFAKNYLQDAIELFDNERFNSSASRAYYASYQAMWAALGDPKDGRIWRHLAIIKHFVRGYWFEPKHPQTGPGLLEDKRLPLRRLYSYRVKSDYDAVEIDQNNLAQLLKVVKQVRLLQKSLFVIPEVFIGNPVFFKIKDFWIPAFAGMTAIAILSILLQEPQVINIIEEKGG